MMLDGDKNTLPEDSVPDLRGVVDRLRSFDNFLGHLSSKDLDNIVLADHHNQSLLDFNESCMLTINKSKNKRSQRQPVKHDGILEKILAQSAVPTTPTSKANEETSSSIRSATRSPRLPSVIRDFPRVQADRNYDQDHEHSHNNTLFSIEEESSDHNKKCQRDLQGRHSSSRHPKEQISHNPTSSPRSTSRLRRKSKEMSIMSEHDTTKALRTEDQGMQNVVPKVASSPRCLSRVLEQHQRRRNKVDPLSPRSLHSEDNASRASSSSSSSKRPHSRQDLYSSTGRRSHKGDRRVSKYQDLLSRLSEPVPTSKETLRTTLERTSSSSSTTLSSTLTNQQEEQDCTKQEQSRSPSCPRPRPVRRTRTNSPKREVNSSSKDCNNDDEKKRQSHRSPRATRKPASQILRSRSTPRTSPQSRRSSKKPSSSTSLVGDGERPQGCRSRSSENIVGQSVSSTSNGDPRTSTSRRRLKSRGSQGECMNEQRARNESLKRMDSLQSFFGTRGGSGIITPTPPAQVKRLASSGELRSPVLQQNATVVSHETNPPSITKKTMNNLMLDLRRETSRNLIQKFKPTRNLQAGIMDDP